MNAVFVERLGKLINELNISQRDLANDIGVTESAISKYLKGERTPSDVILRNLATALNTTCDYLLGISDSDDEKEMGFLELKGLLTRNSKGLTAEERNKLIQIIVKY